MANDEGRLGSVTGPNYNEKRGAKPERSNLAAVKSRQQRQGIASSKKSITYTRRAPGLVESVGTNALRVGSIFITIMVLLIGAPLATKYEDRYINFPNANADIMNGGYVPASQYVDNIDFVTFGEQSIDNVVGFIRGISDIVEPIYRIISGNPSVVVNINGYDYDLNQLRKQSILGGIGSIVMPGVTLANAKIYWLSLTAPARLNYETVVYPGFNWFDRTFVFWSPSDLNS